MVKYMIFVSIPVNFSRLKKIMFTFCRFVNMQDSIGILFHQNNAQVLASEVAMATISIGILKPGYRHVWLQLFSIRILK